MTITKTATTTVTKGCGVNGKNDHVNDDIYEYGHDVDAHNDVDGDDDGIDDYDIIFFSEHIPSWNIKHLLHM